MSPGSPRGFETHVGTRVGIAVGVAATGVGGAVGAVARWSLTDLFPVPSGHFPWVTFAINVVGSGLLAALPLLAVARSRPWLGLLLGTGVLGGFTTMSAASVETFVLLDGGATGLGLAYCVGTLCASLLAVLLVDRLSNEQQRQDFELAEGDE
jgi:fluoride exporter